MHASGRDIVELFGYPANDTTEASLAAWRARTCPFTQRECVKTNHDKSIIYGTCSVSLGVGRGTGKEVIVCPNRLYGNSYTSLKDVVATAWAPTDTLVLGGTITDLRNKALRTPSPVVAFGKHSGREIQINANGQLSMDWILQKYRANGTLRPTEFVGVEVQSIDITGNYRDTWDAYMNIREGQPPTYVPDSGHGLNWANVHKRLIPQLIRKGNIYQNCSRCVGFFFLVPDLVYKKFEEILGNVAHAVGPARNVLSVLTYTLSPAVGPGKIRDLKKVRAVHYSLKDVKEAFSHNTSDEAPGTLDRVLLGVLS